MTEPNDPRIFLAAERTLLAWNRTSLSLVAFGFFVERSGLLIRVLAPEQIHPQSSMMIFIIGIAFILLGAFAALLSLRRYLRLVQSLSSHQIPQGYNVRWDMGFNLIIAFLALILVALLAWGV